MLFNVKKLKYKIRCKTHANIHFKKYSIRIKLLLLFNKNRSNNEKLINQEH